MDRGQGSPPAPPSTSVLQGTPDAPVPPYGRALHLHPAPASRCPPRQRSVPPPTEAENSGFASRTQGSLPSALHPPKPVLSVFFWGGRRGVRKGKASRRPPPPPPPAASCRPALPGPRVRVVAAVRPTIVSAAPSRGPRPPSPSQRPFSGGCGGACGARAVPAGRAAHLAGAVALEGLEGAVGELHVEHGQLAAGVRPAARQPVAPSLLQRRHLATIAPQPPPSRPQRRDALHYS